MTRPLDDTLSVAQAIADPVRLAVLQRLADGPASVSELVAVTQSTQPNVSNHLALLRERRLVRAVKQGRQMVYELRDPAVAHLIETLATLAGAKPKAAVRQSPALAKARTCYDHLAGQVGVRLFEILRARGAIGEPAVLRTLKNAGSPLELGERGHALFSGLGIDVDEVMRGRKPYAFACRDWTERRPHLGGRLGAALWGRFVELGWVERQPGTRVVLVTADGRRGFAQSFGLDLPAA